MSDSEKKIEQEHIRHFLHKTCNQEVLEVSRCSLNGKKVCCTCKVAFVLIRPIFYHSHCLRRLALHDFIFCLSKL